MLPSANHNASSHKCKKEGRTVKKLLVLLMLIVVALSSMTVVASSGPVDLAPGSAGDNATGFARFGPAPNSGDSIPDGPGW